MGFRWKQRVNSNALTDTRHVLQVWNLKSIGVGGGGALTEEGGYI